MAKHLEDIGKDAKDLLTTEFPSDGAIKFTTQCKTSENITVKSTLGRVVKRDKTIREVVSATFEDKLELTDRNIELNGKISSNNDISGTVSVKDIIGDGSKLELNVSQTGDGLYAAPQLIFKNNNVAVNSKVVYPIKAKKQDIKLFVEGGFHTGHLNAGIGSAITLEQGATVINLEGVGSYSHANSQITGRVNHQLHSALLGLGLSYYNVVDPASRIAVEVNTDTTFEKWSLTAGGEHKYDKNTALRGKLVYKQIKKDTELRTVLALKQQIFPSFTAIFGGDLNTRSFFGHEGGDPHSFGVELKFDHK
jgi:hypothetical protein